MVGLVQFPRSCQLEGPDVREIGLQRYPVAAQHRHLPGDIAAAVGLRLNLDAGQRLVIEEPKGLLKVVEELLGEIEVEPGRSACRAASTAAVVANTVQVSRPP